MAKQIRAKFFVSDVLQRVGTDGQVETEIVKLQAVYAPNDDKSENHMFWKATPNGQMEQQINNPEAFGFFKRGAKFYLTFEEAEAG